VISVEKRSEYTDYEDTSPRAVDNRAEEVKLLCRDHAELAIRTLAEICGDDTAKDAPRVLAAKVLLERGFGAQG
jgi:hypothetical protein